MPSPRRIIKNNRQARDARNAKYGGKFGGKLGAPSEFTRERINNAPRNPKLEPKRSHFTSDRRSQVSADDIDAGVVGRAPMRNIKGDSAENI
jgi:hypothetical protein